MPQEKKISFFLTNEIWNRTNKHIFSKKTCSKIQKNKEQKSKSVSGPSHFGFSRKPTVRTRFKGSNFKKKCLGGHKMR